MESTMHGKTLVQVLFPEFKVPKEDLSPEDWAELAFRLHAQLSGFYETTYRRSGSIPSILEFECNSEYVDKHRPRLRHNVSPACIDDSRCESKTKGSIFLATIDFGYTIRQWEWPPERPTKQKSTKKKLPRARRSVHLFISRKGFFIVVVRWVPKIKWWRNPLGQYEADSYAVEAESVVVTQASQQQLASMLRNCNKSKPREAWGNWIVSALLHVQEEVAETAFKRYEEALERLHRIKHSVEAIT